LEQLGLQLHVPLANRLSSLTTVRIPEGVDGQLVQSRLRDEFNIEIAGGLGELKGKVWRIGLMGYSSQRENVSTLLAALEEILS
ncbi:MAG: alanine--glyoxylate aminotransferase family protein, partial [Anaerolineales bacterium]